MTNDEVVNTQDPVMTRNLRKLFTGTPSAFDMCYRCGDIDSWWEPTFIEVGKHRALCRECVKVAMDNIENEKQEIVDAIIMDIFRKREPELTEFVGFHGGMTTSNRRKMGVLANIR